MGPNSQADVIRMGGDAHHQHEKPDEPIMCYVGWPKEAPLTELLTFCCRGKKDSWRSRGNTMILREKLEHDESVKEQKWFGLFTDLIFVTVIIQFALQITEHYKGFYLLPHNISKRYSESHNENCQLMANRGASGIFLTDDGLSCDLVDGGEQIWLSESLLWLFAFYVVWLELGCSLGRFINIDGVLDDFLYFASIFFTIGMAIQINSRKHMMLERDGFSIWTCAVFMALLILHLFYYCIIEECRRYAHRRVWTYAVAIVINAAGGLGGYWTNFCSILVSCLVVFYVSLTGFVVQRANDLTVEHFVERFGLLTMITCGESILALIISDGYTQAWRQNQIVILSFVIMYVLKDQYFNTDAPEKVHALTKSEFPGSCMWVFLHFPLCYLLLLLGVGFKLMFKEFSGGEDEHKTWKYMLLWPLAGSLIVIDLIPLTHRYYKFSLLSVSLKLVPIIAIVPIGLILTDTIHLLLWCGACTILHLVIDVRLKEYQINQDMLHRTHLTTEDDEMWKEWRTTGFMGPKFEIWPVYLVIDYWKRETNDNNEPVNMAEKRAEQAGVDPKLIIPSKHFREEENTRDWLMEFGDLILVAVIYKFADQMKYTLKNYNIFNSRTVIIESTVFFAAFFCIWLELVTEFVRFKNMPGPIDDVVRFLYLLGLVMMATQCGSGQYLMTNRTGFLVSFVCSLSSIFFLHICYQWKGIDHAVTYCRRRVVLYGMVIISTMVSVGVPYRAITSYYLPFCILVLNVVLLLITSFNSFRVVVPGSLKDSIMEQHQNHHAGAHGHAEQKEELQHQLTFIHEEEDEIEDHFLERFGLFVMITAGESILALVIAYEAFEETIVSYMLVYVAFVMVYVIRTQYVFNNVDLLKGHALHNGKSPGSVMFCGIHLILNLFLLWLGVAWKLVFYKWTGGGETKLAYRMYMGAAVTGVMICLIIIRFTHMNFNPGPLSWLRLIPVGAVMFICYYGTSPLFFSIGCTVCLFCLLVMDHKFYNITYEVSNTQASNTKVSINAPQAL